MEIYHGDPIWVNLDLVTNIRGGTMAIQHTEKQKSTPWKELPKTPVTFIGFALESDGSEFSVMVQETPEQIFTLERNTR